MPKASLQNRSPAFHFLGWFGRVKQTAVEAIRGFVSCKSHKSDDSFAEYTARTLGDPERLGPQDNCEKSLPCSIMRHSFQTDDNFARVFAKTLRDLSPVCLRGGGEQNQSTDYESPNICSSSKSDDNFAEYLAYTVRDRSRIEFQDNQGETLSTCSVQQDTCSSPKSDFDHAEMGVEACHKESPLCYFSPPDVWSNRNGGRSPLGFVGRLDANTSTRLAAICKSQKSEIFEGLHHIRELDSVIASSYANTDQCRCIGENTISSVSSVQPRLPANFFDLTTRIRLRAVKQYLDGFEYRMNPMSKFQVKKLRPLSGLMATAKLIIHQPEPIKCVEAVFIALYLTAGLKSVTRIPIGFKTQFANQVFQHIVLLVQYKGKYGAFGISRSPDLMNKNICYDSMSSIIEDFKTAYEESDHTILNLKIGLQVEHNIMSPNFVCWEHLCLCPAVQPWPECLAAIEKHASRMKHLWSLWIISGRGDDPTRRSLKCSKKLLSHDETSKKKAKLMNRKQENLLKSSKYRKEFQGHAFSSPLHRGQSILLSAVADLPTAINENKCQHSNEQLSNPRTPSSVTTSVNQSMFTAPLNPESPLIQTIESGQELQFEE
nr:uncharacterized protein LOC112279716 isoform X1 [Physcomitrium patens]|eukprot:XP_024370159.1 uncharacterized protein LOC112279716 isoform X1 [Physcomitrella patens]